MVKNKSLLKRFVVTLSTLAVTLGALTGCSPEKKADELSDKLLDVMVRNEMTVSDFALIGTDVIKSSFDFDVNFNGVVSLQDKSKAFATLKYVVPSTEFENLSKKSSFYDVYDVFNLVVDSYEMDSWTIASVSDIVAFNDVMVKNAPPAFDGYKTTRGMVYNLSTPVFDNENRTASFDVKVIAEYKEDSRHWVDAGFGIGFSNSGIGLGYGVFLDRKDKEGTFTSTDRYTLSFSEEEFAQVQANPDWVYDICADAIAHKDQTQLKAERINTNMVTYDSADVLKSFDLEDTVYEMN